MKLFPTKELNLRLVSTPEESLERLKRRTEMSTLHSDKPFRGEISGNEFRLHSRRLELGVFCVMTGQVKMERVQVKVEIIPVAKVLLSLLFVVPVFGLVAMIISEVEEFSPFLILVTIGQLLMIRLFFIGLAFRLFSGICLNKLRDVMDLELMNE